MFVAIETKPTPFLYASVRFGGYGVTALRIAHIYRDSCVTPSVTLGAFWGLRMTKDWSPLVSADSAKRAVIRLRNRESGREPGGAQMPRDSRFGLGVKKGRR